jgi:hypothetical protein
VPRQSRRQGGPAGNLYPTKQRAEQKIDAAVALMAAMSLEGFLTNPIFR